MLVICSFLLMESAATTCRVVDMVDMVDAEIPHVCFQTKHVSCRNPRTWLDNPLISWVPMPDLVVDSGKSRNCLVVDIGWCWNMGFYCLCYTGASGLWCVDMYIIPQFEGIRGLYPHDSLVKSGLPGFTTWIPLDNSKYHRQNSWFSNCILGSLKRRTGWSSYKLVYPH